MSTLSWYSNLALKMGLILPPEAMQPADKDESSGVSCGSHRAADCSQCDSRKNTKHGDVSIEHWDFPCDINGDNYFKYLQDFFWCVSVCVCIATMEDDMDG